MAGQGPLPSLLLEFNAADYLIPAFDSIASPKAGYAQLKPFGSGKPPGRKPRLLLVDSAVLAAGAAGQPCNEESECSLHSAASTASLSEVRSPHRQRRVAVALGWHVATGTEDTESSRPGSPVRDLGTYSSEHSVPDSELEYAAGLAQEGSLPITECTAAASPSRECSPTEAPQDGFQTPLACLTTAPATANCSTNVALCAAPLQPLLPADASYTAGQLSAGQQGADERAPHSNDPASLQKKLEQQEVLLSAYQAENELAVARMKQQKAEQQQQLADAQQQIEDLQQQLALAQRELERRLPPTPAADAARLQELLQVQAQLVDFQATAEQRERELLGQVDELRREKLEMQGQLHDMVQQREAGSQLLQETQAQLADSDALVQQQAQLIKQLEQQLMLQDGSTGSIHELAGSGAAGALGMQQLQAENASLRQALQQLQAQQLWQQADSGRSREDALAAELQGKLARLQEMLQVKEEQHMRQLRAMQREQERLRVEQGIRSASMAGAARVRELEAQLEEVRTSGARRVRVLEAKLKEAEAQARKGPEHAAAPCARGAARSAGQPQAPAAEPKARARAASGDGPPARPVGRGAAAAAQQQAVLAAANTQLQQKEQRVRRLESELCRKDAELVALQKRLATADQQLNQAAEKQEGSAAALAASQQALAEVTAANSSLQAQAKEASVLRRQLAEQQSAVQQLQQQVERLQAVEASLEVLRREHAEAAWQAESREAQHAAELARVQQEQAALLEAARQAGRDALASEYRSRVQQLEEQAAEWRGRAAQLERDLKNARAGIPWTPSAADFAALERRMHECEERAEQREAHWRRVAEDCTRAAAAQQERLRLRYEGALLAKEQQVGEFKEQLDALLVAARRYQAGVRS